MLSMSMPGIIGYLDMGGRKGREDGHCSSHPRITLGCEKIVRRSTWTSPGVSAVWTRVLVQTDPALTL